MPMVTKLKDYLQNSTNASPLIVFRIGFGIMMLYSLIRFWVNGWIKTLYLQPKFHFSYYGFEWVKPIGNYTYLVFILCGIAALLITLGYKYRFAVVLFFLSFTYIELMDKTTYLNHYYFISLVSFLLFFLPANARFSIDAYHKKVTYQNVPNWTIDSIKLMLGIVYFYAGLAKVNSDWLFKAQPLKIWLTSRYDLPLIGEALMHQNWFHYAMSWGGMIYDLCIPFLLLYRKTRWIAFGLVVFFHVFTRILFPIGVFPFVMIFGSLIFFDTTFHDKIIALIKKGLDKITTLKGVSIKTIESFQFPKKSIGLYVVGVFFCFQIALPFRHVFYPGELFWTEEGFRFSWRVMLMEKMGSTTFKVVDTETNKYFYVDNSDFLTPFQEKQMSFQPDFILEYAHYLGEHFASQGHQNIAIFAESFVALNGRMSQPFVDPKRDLLQETESFKHKTWILPFNDDIKGL